MEKNLILLGSILIFMDQQITAVIVNRKEHKLEVSEHTSSHPDKSQPNPYPDYAESLENYFSGLRPIS